MILSTVAPLAVDQQISPVELLHRAADAGVIDSFTLEVDSCKPGSMNREFIVRTIHPVPAELRVDFEQAISYYYGPSKIRWDNKESVSWKTVE